MFHLTGGAALLGFQPWTPALADARSLHVADLKERVKTGRYVVDEARVAESMLDLVTGPFRLLR